MKCAAGAGRTARRVLLDQDELDTRMCGGDENTPEVGSLQKTDLHSNMKDNPRSSEEEQTQRTCGGLSPEDRPIEKRLNLAAICNNVKFFRNI